MKGWRGGAYAFDGTYTRASSTAVSQYGQGIAAFMLGIPLNGSFIELRPEQDYSVMSHGFFVHDDWRVGEKLTLNLGVRYDLELGMTEAENRNVRGFDFTTANPIQAQAQAQFAANPPAGVPLTAAQFAVLGGYQYVDDANRRIWDADTNNFQPRFGFTYAATPTTIVRGGAGLFISPFQINAVPGLGNPVNQLGYARQTPVPVTSDNGLTFQANLTNPVPSGQLLPAEWLESRAAHQPRGQRRDPRDRRRASSRPIGSTPSTGGSALASSANSEATGSSSCPISGRRARTCPSSSSSTSYRRLTARRARFVTTRPRRSSARSSRTHFRDSRRTRRAAAARPSPGGGCCCSIRTSTT